MGMWSVITMWPISLVDSSIKFLFPLRRFLVRHSWFVGFTTALIIATGTLHAAIKEDLIALAAGLPNVSNPPLVKAVWVRANLSTSIGGERGNYYEEQVLMQIDSETGIEDTLMDSLTNYREPMITHDGTQVIWSNMASKTIHRVDWTGENHVVIAAGLACCLWFDESGGNEYLIYAKDCSGEDYCEIYKKNLATGDETLFFNGIDSYPIQYAINPSWFSISSNGQVLTGAWPWGGAGLPGSGLITFNVSGSSHPDSALMYGTGCWPIMPYTNEYTLFTFTEDHFAFKKYTPDMQGPPALWEIGYANYPRFSSYNPNLLCVTIGYDEPTTVPGNAAIFRVNDTYTEVEDSVILAATPVMNEGWVDAWVAPEATVVHQPSRKAIPREFTAAIPREAGDLFNINGARIGKTQHRMPSGIAIVRYRSQDGTVHAEPIVRVVR